jgi:peptidoglycan/LPS O-acetylase OafA/YrhL
MLKRWTKWALFVSLLVVCLLVVLAPVAMAATGDDAALPAQTQLWGLLVAAAVPFVTGLLVRKSYRWWLKALIAAGLAAAVGVVSTYLAGAWSGDVWQFILECYGVAMAVFVTVIQNVPGLKDKLYGLLNKDPVDTWQ